MYSPQTLLCFLSVRRLPFCHSSVHILGVSMSSQEQRYILVASRLALFSTKRHNRSELRLPNFCIRHHWSVSHEFRMFFSSEFDEPIIVDHGQVVPPHDGARCRIQHDQIDHLMQLLWPCFRRSYCGGAPVRVANELGVWSLIALPAECGHFPCGRGRGCPDDKSIPSSIFQN